MEGYLPLARVLEGLLQELVQRENSASDSKQGVPWKKFEALASYADTFYRKFKRELYRVCIHVPHLHHQLAVAHLERRTSTRRASQLPRRQLYAARIRRPIPRPATRNHLHECRCYMLRSSQHLKLSSRNQSGWNACLEFAPTPKPNLRSMRQDRSGMAIALDAAFEASATAIWPWRIQSARRITSWRRGLDAMLLPEQCCYPANRPRRNEACSSDQPRDGASPDGPVVFPHSSSLRASTTLPPPAALPNLYFGVYLNVYIDPQAGNTVSLRPMVGEAVVGGIAHAARRWGPLRHRLLQGLTVFLFHNVSETSSPFLSRYGLTTHPYVFASQVQWIARTFEVVHPACLVEDDSTLSLPSRAAVLTFDDAWAGTFEVAFPIQQMGVPESALQHGDDLW